MMGVTAIIILVVAGGSLVVGGMMLHDRRSIRSLTVRLQLPYAENDETLLREGLRRISRLEVDGSSRRWPEQSVQARLEPHLIPMAVGAAVGLLMAIATGQVVLALVLGAAVP